MPGGLDCKSSLDEVICRDQNMQTDMSIYKLSQINTTLTNFKELNLDFRPNFSAATKAQELKT